MPSSQRVGVRLHRYRDRLLHAKNVSIDGRIAVIGSSNADVRSFMLNAEISLILHDEASAGPLADVQRGHIRRSDQLLLEEWRDRSGLSRFSENLARLVSPLL
ncbi:phospholipase D-like domain-containing protein [Sphingobium sp. MP9-4]|uniref:phospholipase D-like domain-containing protein n=1 Tax=Sphingobium sp. MP9-4 TaxID=1761936 RepID=UPI000AAC3B52|nr:phospholipase D-like domain-containing protein [Sphingobium sp. MP9-4]